MNVQQQQQQYTAFLNHIIRRVFYLMHMFDLLILIRLYVSLSPQLVLVVASYH